MSEKKVVCEVWSRCVGYYRPIRYMNIGKQQEISERKVYEVPSNMAADSLAVAEARTAAVSHD